MDQKKIVNLGQLEKMMKQTNILNGIIHLFPMLLILFVCLYYLEDKQTIVITGDEYGYWAAGSYFAGLDWSEVTSINPYYGYGYGIILSLILKVTSSQITAYRAAICINAFFLCIIYLIAFQIIREVTCAIKIPKIIQMIIAFTATMYTDNVYYTQYTMSETLIAVLYWLTLYLFVLMQKKVTYWRSFLFFLVLVYSFSVHMRTIGVLITSITMWIYIVWKQKKKIVQFVFPVVIFGTMILLLAVYIKAIYKQGYYSKVIEVQSDVNELAGQIGKIQLLFSMEGMKSFLTAFFGKVFYAITSSFLLVGIAIVILVQKMKKSFLEWKASRKVIIEDNIILLIYMCFSLVSMMGIGSLYMIAYNDRFDLLTYGRYFSYTVSPLIMLIIIFLYKESFLKKMKITFWAAFLYLLIAVWINDIQNYDLLKNKTFINDVFVASIMRFDYVENSLLILSLSAVLIYGCFVVVLIMQERTKQTLLFGIATGILIVSWVSCGKYVYKNGCLNWSIAEQSSELNLYKYIEENEIGNDLFYSYSENVLKIDTLQFLLKQNTVHCVSDLEEFEELQIEGYLLTPAKTKYAEILLEKNYVLLAESLNLKLWRKLE